jgi:hypothetical protein
MSSTGNIFPGTGASVDRAVDDVAWTNPGDVVSDNATDTTCALSTFGSDYLVTSGYGFALPSNAIIHGVTVRVEASESGSGTSNYIPQLISATTPTLIGAAKSAVSVSGATKVISTNGGVTDLWSATLTPAIVNAAGFGVAIWSDDTTNTLAIDFVTIAIEYSIPLTPTRFTAEQQYQNAALEVAGYGALFAAAAALLLAPPPPADVVPRTLVAAPAQEDYDRPLALVFGQQPISADSIGAADYTVGSHNAAIAEGQARGRVWGTPAILIPSEVADQFGKTLVAAPQEVDQLSASVFGTAPPSFDAPEPRLFAVFPQFYDDSSAAVYGTAPPSVDTPIPQTLVAAPELVTDGASVLFGQQPGGIDIPLLRTLSAAPEQIDSPAAYLWGPEPVPLVDVPPPVTRVAAPEQIDLAAAQVWGQQPESVLVGADPPPPRTQFAAPEQIEFPAGYVWGPQPRSADRIGAADYSVGHQNVEISTAYHAGRVWGTPDILIEPPVAAIRKPYTLVAAPEQIDLPSASIFATPTPLMPVAAVVLGRFTPAIFATPPQLEVGDTWYWGTTTGFPAQPHPRTLVSALPQIEPVQTAKVWGSLLQTAAPVPVHTVFAAPQTIDRTDSLVFSAATQIILEIVAPVPARFVNALPQYDDAGIGLVFGQEPASADPIIGRTLTTSQLESDGAAYVFGEAPESVVLNDPIGRTFIAGQFESDGAAVTFGTVPQLTPDPRDPPIGHTLSAGQFEVDGSAAIFGTQPISTEALGLRPIIAGQYETDGAATLFGQQPESAAPVYPRTIIAGQYESDGRVVLWREASLAAVVPRLTDVNIYVEAVFELQFAVARNPIDMEFTVERSSDIHITVKI